MRTGVSHAVLVASLACACALVSERDGRRGPDGAEPPQAQARLAGNPRQGAVPLPADGGWEAFLVLDNDPTGIWTVDAFDVFEQYGCPEVVGLDDLGRCHVLVSYSGKWTPLQTVGEGKWLGGLAHGDVDPRIPGRELYTGGQKGNLYQVLPYRQGVLDCRLIAHLPGREIHTLVAGDVDPRTAGPELLVFTRPGGLYRVTPSGPDGRFETELLQELEGRVRDAVLLPDGAIATVSRAGKLQLLRLTNEGPQWTTLYEDSMGLGRLAVSPSDPNVLYATHDDGRILRVRRDTVAVETIYRGPQGPRGMVAGRFDPDPNVETVAIFGYSRRVELLTRGPAGWTTQTLFTDRDKGHWLASAELDGRNETREILLSGYGARIVLLARPPGP